ncbi:hypothetical protein [Bacillus cereus]|uniref:hypothetical protein n=1 Tax=Bacillus TaxID=1386 RepID=UPI003012CBD9
MGIYEYLDQIQTELLDHSWQEIEVKYYDLCSKLAGEEQAKRIRNIDLDAFQNKLNDTLYTSIHTADKHSAAAIYFEYDMDNDWQSVFFICNDYTALLEEGDDWASDWINEVEVPNLNGFARIYAESGYHDLAPSHEFYKFMHSGQMLSYRYFTTLHQSKHTGFDALFPFTPKQEFVKVMPNWWVN